MRQRGREMWGEKEIERDVTRGMGEREDGNAGGEKNMATLMM